MNEQVIPGAMSPEEMLYLSFIAKQYQPKRLLEIGSFAGRSLVNWARQLPDSEIWSVDPMRSLKVSDWPDIRRCGFTEEELEEPLYKAFLKYTRPYKNIRHIRAYSEEMLTLWTGEPFDLCFIDGDHSTPAVINDLEVAKVVTNDGAICGHDYDYQAVKEEVHKWADLNQRKVVPYGETIFSLEHIL